MRVKIWKKKWYDLSWNKTKNQLQITSNFNFKSPLTVVRANYGLSVAVFGFVIGGIVFEILSFFWQNNAFFGKS